MPLQSHHPSLFCPLSPKLNCKCEKGKNKLGIYVVAFRGFLVHTRNLLPVHSLKGKGSPLMLKENQVDLFKDMI